MKIHTLLWREIAHRKLNFAIGLLAVAVAAAGSVGVVALLGAYQTQTSIQLADQESQLKRQMETFQAGQAVQVAQAKKTHEQAVRKLDDEIRKITKDLGFNIFILPAEQNLTEFYAANFAEKTMPEEYVHKLAKKGDMFTIRHLRPALIRKVEWPEKNRSLLLMGVADVVPQAHLDPQKPLGDSVPVGAIFVGDTLARELNLKPKDEVTLRGKNFRVDKVYPAQGNKDDITAWINLKTIQEMLDMTGRINMIQGLECNCATVDRLAEIQKDISSVLGDKVQVIEVSGQAIARAKARNQVESQGQARLKSIIKQGDDDLKKIQVEGITTMKRIREDATATLGRLQAMTAIVLPLMIVVACVMVGLLALINVRERRVEIGILRALGTRSRQIFALFVARSALVGLAGAALGYGIGVLSAAAWAGSRTDHSLLVPEMLVGLLLVGPLLAVLAGWLPAMLAANEDPAIVLRDN
ncbi:MAG: FtsX-like permease family protein [Planctomycetes bacterium]|nr:FtsX-like permease family protein [Planctomycetota bacterium]